MKLSGPIGNLAKWALRQSLGTARGNLVIALIEGPIGALLNAIVLTNRGQLELERLNNQAKAVLGDTQ